MGAGAANARGPAQKKFLVLFPKRTSSFTYVIVGIENSAPSFTPEGQREVTVFVLV